MNKENCYKGRTNIKMPDNRTAHIVVVERERFTPIAKVPKGREADAQLIAEVFDILHETGFTPRELKDRLKAIHDGLNACENVDELRDTAAMCIVQSTFKPEKG